MRLTVVGLVAVSGAIGTIACGDEPAKTFAGAPSGAQGALAQPIIFGDADCDGPHQRSSGALLFEGSMQFQLGDVSGRTVLCSAVLIAPDVALTAAHCVDLRAIGALAVQTTARAVSFTADLRDVYDNGGAFPADAVAIVDDDVAPGFDADAFRAASGGLGAQYDWALLYLERAVDPDVATPVTVLSGVDAPLRVGDSVDVVGHGTADPAGAIPGEGTTGQRLCGASFVNLLGDDEIQVGSGGQTLRRCEVDSGGPTFVTRQGEPLLASVGSRAFAAQDEQACGQGAIDTRVDAIVDVIDAAMRAACADGRRRDCREPGLRHTPAPTPDAGIVDAGSDTPDAGSLEDVDAGADDVDGGAVVDAGANDDDDDDIDGDGGCGCRSDRPSDLAEAGALALLVLMGGRRRQRRGAR